MAPGAEAMWGFLFPKFDRRFFLRLGGLAATAFLVFRFLLMPCWINGRSMEPTYSRIGFNLCWKPAYWFRAPALGDVVAIRYAGREYLLKRIVALEGDTVEFRKGVLFRNGKAQSEPYVRLNAGWDLPPRRVEPGHVYAVGDNRGMPISEHKFGSVDARRVVGTILW